MRTGFEQLCISHLPQLGLKPAQKGQEEKNGVGFTFVPEPEVGDGYLWTYPINTTCSLTVYDVVFHRDMSFCYHHPAALTVAVSSPGSAEPAVTKPCTNPENLVGYFLEEGTFGHTIPKNTPVRSIGISLMPEFYEQQLPALMGQGATQVRKAACSLDGSVSLPEVESLLRQMGAYMPQSGTAGLRYEAKIFDLLSALLEWNDLTLSTPAVACISAKDQEALQSLKHFLRQNYSAQVDLPRLAQMCYMSKSKLTYLFRMLYGTTIYEFVLACRIDRAKELLADQEKKISEIATLVGYERQSSFSAAFHQRTGITPNEFRRQLGN